MAPEREDWKRKLKALGVARKRRPKRTKEDLLGRKEGEAAAAARHAPDALPRPSSSFEEKSSVSLRTSRRILSGRSGEERAVALLSENKLTILDRNVRYADGELDVVADDGGTTVFVEVKRRASVLLGAPGEAVGPVKRRRVVRAARRWLAAHPGRARAVRFDVVALVDDPPSVTWVRDAFDRDARA